MQKRIRLQDVAKRLGVHFSTVSRALRDDPRLPAATIRRVKSAARKMGYEPDPNAKAMAVYRHAILPSSLRNTLALLAPESHVSYADELLSDVRPHAESLGYQIDLVPAYPAGKSGSRLTRILQTRGTAGLLVMPPAVEARALRRLQLDWSRFPAVILGHGLFWPPLHRVCDNHFRNAKQLVRQMTALGYRRIGMCVHPLMASIYADGGWRGGYVAEMERFGECPRPFSPGSSVFNRGLVRDWITQEKLDSVIVVGCGDVKQFRDTSGFSVPEELGVAGLMVQSPDISGINPEFERVWTNAVDFLVYLIRTNQRGIPAFPQRILIEGTWVPGKTVRRINRMKNEK